MFKSKKVQLGIIIAFSILLVLMLLSLLGIMSTSGLGLFFSIFLGASIWVLIQFSRYVYSLNEGLKRKFFIWLSVYLVVVGGAYIIVQSVEWITGWIFLYKFTWWPFYMILLIYPFSTWLLFLSQYLFSNKKVIFLVSSLFVIGTLVTAYIHIFIAFLGSKSTTDVTFDDKDIELVLVESSFLFSSTHELYEKVNPLFVDQIYSSGSWTCDDGCVIRSPESYVWTWINDTTLKVENDGMFEPIFFYFND